MLLNFHTHRPCPAGEQTVPSLGLHPWHVAADWSARLDSLFADVAPPVPSPEAPLLVGECGLDRACAVPYALQLQAFEAQIALSEQLHLPLVLHCVRAMDDVLRLHRTATQPWVWHGFRGKPDQLRQLLKAGLYVSFGWHHNTASVEACPTDRFFLETDDGPAAIGPLYTQVATLRRTSEAALVAQMWHNLSALTCP